MGSAGPRVNLLNVEQGNILQVAKSAGSFNTLLAAVKAAGLEETLSGPGPLTVFAPTDEAFAKLPKGTLESLLKPENKNKLISILTYHVVPGKYPAAKVLQQKSLKSASGKTLSIKTTEGVMVNRAQVTKTDIMASNGVIHVIDTVMIP
jgi:uncharacterized surface protein with fasciclin (FAS1) repeats